jgi:hypothetical protein
MCIKLLGVRPLAGDGIAASAAAASAGTHMGHGGIMCDVKRSNELEKLYDKLEPGDHPPSLPLKRDRLSLEKGGGLYPKIGTNGMPAGELSIISGTVPNIQEIQDNSYATLWIAPDMVKVGDMVIHRDEAEDIIVNKSFYRLNFLERGDSNGKVHYFLQYYMTSLEDSFEIMVINEVPLMWEVSVAPKQACNTILKGQRELIQIELMSKMAAQLKAHPVRSKVRHALNMGKSAECKMENSEL